MDGQPRPGYDGAKRTKANLSFCFESHGEFAYEKGQEFFFRGDDDIWVFINNKFVIDLGGIHNPAPGFVDLDTRSRIINISPRPLISMSNLRLVNAILHIVENGSKNGVLSRLFEALQAEGIIRISMEVLCLDSTTVKVHPDGTGGYGKALYKRRNEVERLFLRIKRFRRISTRYDKLDAIYRGFIFFAMIADVLTSVNTL